MAWYRSKPSELQCKNTNFSIPFSMQSFYIAPWASPHIFPFTILAQFLCFTSSSGITVLVQSIFQGKEPGDWTCCECGGLNTLLSTPSRFWGGWGRAWALLHHCHIKKVKQKELHTHFSAGKKQKIILVLFLDRKMRPWEENQAQPLSLSPTLEIPTLRNTSSVTLSRTKQEDGICKTIKEHKNKVILQKARGFCLIFSVWLEWYFILFTQSKSEWYFILFYLLRK